METYVKKEVAETQTADVVYEVKDVAVVRTLSKNQLLGQQEELKKQLVEVEADLAKINELEAK